MRGTPDTSHSGTTAASERQALGFPPPTARSNWLNLVWKLLLAALILLLMSIGSPLSWVLSWTFLNPVPATLLVWGGLVVGIGAGNLLEGPLPLRIAWTALTLGAYLALTLPPLVTNTPSRTIDAVGPVAALTLAAHLGRRDLQRAVRDWALVMSLALYGALGVQAMWLVVGVFSNDGPLVFLVAVLFPPILFEAIMLTLRHVGTTRFFAPLVALAASTLLSAVAVSTNLLNRTMALEWMLLFGVIIAVLIGSGLVVSYLTRPLVEASSGAYGAISRTFDLARAVVELSHGPILISLALYIPLRLLR